MIGEIAATARDVRSGKISALALAQAAIARIRRDDPAINAVTRLLEARALADAGAVDAIVARGCDPGALAGVPFAVKDLFDVAGLATTAGSAIRANAPPAIADAEAVRRLAAAGAVLVATCNMDEFAYGFATVNAHYGTTRNPHDRARIAGGSSGGSAAAVAAAMVPFTLGSDTNGSIRIPAALCGLYGLKPTHGELPDAGVAAFATSFDDIGPIAATLADLALIYEVLRGAPLMADDAGALRIGRLRGWFDADLDADLAAGLAAIGDTLAAADVDLPEVAAARPAAFIITAAEGGARHCADLTARAAEYDPATRDRLIAGALQPGGAVAQARRFRDWFRAAVAAAFDRYDVLIAPTTAGVAPRIDQPTVRIGGQDVSARAHLGIFTQPLSFIGLPALAVPLRRAGKLPLGIQLVGPPGGEDRLFALAARLEDMGLIGAGATMELQR